MSDAKTPAVADKKSPEKNAVEQVVIDVVKDILTPAQQKQVVDRLSPRIESLVISVAKFHSGPLPSVETVQGYEAIAPGSFDRIIAMAELDQKAVIDSQNFAARQDASYRKLCLGAGLFALVLILAIIVLLAVINHTTEAIAVSGVGAVGVITAFVNGRWPATDEKNGTNKKR